MKIAPTQLSEKEFSSLKNDINKTLQDIRNGIVHAQGRKSTRHGKAGEIAVCKLLNFRNQDGTLYEQNGMGCDVPKSVVERSNLPKELHCDVEVKYYEAKSRSLLGDASKKIKKLKKGLVLIKAFYDKTPDNPLPQIHIEKIVPSAEDLKAFEHMEKIVAFVKDKSNPIKGSGGTREKVKQENKKFRTTRFFLNNNSNTKTNGRQIQLADRWS